nr:transcriptional regulator [Enterocloster sp.]
TQESTVETEETEEVGPGVSDKPTKAPETEKPDSGSGSGSDSTSQGPGSQGNGPGQAQSDADEGGPGM